MNKPTYSPYATNALGRIVAPKGAPKNEPKSTVIRTEADLRVGRTAKKAR